MSARTLDLVPMYSPLTGPNFPDERQMARQAALRTRWGADFRTVSGECVGHIPRIRLSPGPGGIRSVTVHGGDWDEVLGALEDITAGDHPGYR